MRIVFIGHEGKGYAQRLDVTDGTTVGEFIERKVGDASGYKIRHNNQPAVASDVLNEGDRLVVTPTKVEGA